MNISIREAAKRLGVSLNTMRKWDEIGALPASRFGDRTHRFYSVADIESFLIKTKNFKLAKKWVMDKKGKQPDSLFYCDLSALFQARLVRMERELSQDKRLIDFFSLIVAAAGEIGNNSFDHNLGNWLDIPGIFFSYNLERGEIILADRGRGILKTLQKVKPELKDDAEALKVAFTEILSGRAPESRGNGLKLVRNIVKEYPVSVFLQSGAAVIDLKKKSGNLNIKKTTEPISGCLVLIKF